VLWACTTVIIWISIDGTVWIVDAVALIVCEMQAHSSPQFLKHFFSFLWLSSPSVQQKFCRLLCCAFSMLRLFHLKHYMLSTCLFHRDVETWPGRYVTNMITLVMIHLFIIVTKCDTLVNADFCEEELRFPSTASILH
jgi:hypothetical protein